MLTSLRGRMGILFLAFYSLILFSVAVLHWASEVQLQDALVINLAGRQRMLTERMVRLALTRRDEPELRATIEQFEQTLHALETGGATRDPRGEWVTLPAAPDDALRAQLATVRARWTMLQAALDARNAGDLARAAARMLPDLDALVSAYQARAHAKVAQMQFEHLALLISALLLLASAYWVMRRRLLEPLVALGAAARQIGQGHLNAAIPTMGNDELGELARSFETMRAELAAAHTQLEARVAQRTRELESAFEFSQEITAQLELTHLLRSVTDRARRLTGSEAAALCLLDTEHKRLARVAANGVPTTRPTPVREMQAGLSGRVVGGNETVITETACTDCGFLRAYAQGACMVTPLRAGTTTLGAMCVARCDGNGYGDDDTRTLILFANAAALAISNAQLIQARRAQAEQAAILTERERLAGELHDNLAQTLSFLNLKTDQIKDQLNGKSSPEVERGLAECKAAIHAAYGQVRAALVGLDQTPIAADDFAPRLYACVDELRKVTGLEVELILADPAALHLPAATQLQVLNIVREALNNARRHAHARQIEVTVERDNGAARFSVADDGCGFDPTAVGSENHLGLTIMRTRAERSGGRLELESAPGAGTRLSAVFPLDSAGGEIS